MATVYKVEVVSHWISYTEEELDFGRNWSSDEKIVVTFAWDEDLSNRTNDGTVPDWVVGRWENGR